MDKIKFIADSTCDISKEEAKKYGIRILPILIFRDDHVYKDWYDFEPSEFYKFLDDSESLPTTSQITPETYLKAFEETVEEGYNNIIYACLNSRASGSYQSALVAKKLFYETPGREHIRLEVIDSTSYSYLIGSTVINAVEKANNGECFDDIVAFMKERFSRITAFAIVYTLDYLKKTGRISDFTCLMGSMLDIKPIIRVGESKIVSYDRARGKKKSVSKLIELVKENIDPEEKEIYIVNGDLVDELIEMENIVKKEFPGYTVKRAKVGSVIAINSGPHVLGLGFVRKK